MYAVIITVGYIFGMKHRYKISPAINFVRLNISFKHFFENLLIHNSLCSNDKSGNIFFPNFKEIK